MSIIQFLRILWAYRVMTFVTTVSTLAGAIVAVLIVPPSYEASTRVVLNILKPDPVTGETMGGDRARTYIDTQRELIKDTGVAGQAVDVLGWASNPELISAYEAAGSPEGGLRRWIAQTIVDRTNVDVVGGTNMLRISYRASSPVEAAAMANALRNAYIEATLSSRRGEAMRNADWFSQQANKEKELLTAADEAKTAFERETGLVMGDDKTDIETERLRSLASQAGGPPVFTAGAPIATASPAALQLAQLDAQISQASQSLGANHPAMIDLKNRRATLAKIVAQDQAAAREAVNASARTAAEGANAIQRAVQAQTARVVAQRDKIQRLNQLQAEVNLHREQMQKALERASSLRQEAAIADPGLSVLGEALTPSKPAFPNIPLIVGGGLVLGAGLGMLLSLIVELLSRRIRGVEDLTHAIEAPLMAVIPVNANIEAANSQPARRLPRLPRGSRRAA